MKIPELVYDVLISILQKFWISAQSYCSAVFNIYNVRLNVILWSLDWMQHSRPPKLKAGWIWSEKSMQLSQRPRVRKHPNFFIYTALLSATPLKHQATAEIMCSASSLILMSTWTAITWTEQQDAWRCATSQFSVCFQVHPTTMVQTFLWKNFDLHFEAWKACSLKWNGENVRYTIYYCNSHTTHDDFKNKHSWKLPIRS